MTSDLTSEAALRQILKNAILLTTALRKYSNMGYATFAASTVQGGQIVLRQSPFETCKEVFLKHFHSTYVFSVFSYARASFWCILDLFWPKIICFRVIAVIDIHKITAKSVLAIIIIFSQRALNEGF